MGAAKSDSISDDFNFYHMADTACGEKFGLSGAGIALSRKFEDSPLQYSGSADSKEIGNWALEKSLPEVIPYSKQFAKIIMSRPALILFSDDKDAEYQTTFANIAKELKGDTLFVTSGLTGKPDDKFAEMFGATSPTIRYINGKSPPLKYTWDGNVADGITAEAMKSF